MILSGEAKLKTIMDNDGIQKKKANHRQATYPCPTHYESQAAQTIYIVLL